MTWLDRLNPTPEFPPYSGPYVVGSTDVEIPVSELKSPSPAPNSSESLSTVTFRVFYPCQPDATHQTVRWIPNPQRDYVGAYARFLGANSAFSHIFSFIPQLLYYISIPVYQNAHILEPPTQSKRWPVMIFSHGLGGSRNSYSHLCGSLSSHGVVVVAPDHRDGSSPVSFVQPTDGKSGLKQIEYRKIPHKASTEVYESRDEQLRIRLWELGLVHDAVLKIDEGNPLTNHARYWKANGRHDVLSMLTSKLEVQGPGSISFAGHSFGAATIVQFVKSSFYLSGALDPNYRPLFAPSKASSIVRQVTPATPVILLDLWALPIQSPATAWLKNKPMPCYNSPHGGSNLLAILSEAFYKWSANLQETKQIIAKPPDPYSKNSGQQGPHLFYPVSSAHLSQSDFGVLFPWVTTKIFGAKEPERVLKLNVRAILQVLRNHHHEVANTRDVDIELEQVGRPVQSLRDQLQDDKILSKTKDEVRGWVSLSTDMEPDIPAQTGKGPSDALVEGEVLGEVVSEPERY
ncbi:hypothetical protein CC78DRAFT_57681 [Lojkania enalia]|uniref:Putative phospholipase n=1 Tax=Lojkania enalia TaxID=147567 RepID=A0A9P4JYI1_9PLEO|nr:hypothetical protein CC78DRAFT_57681 [Didymosphaeria enalia]